MTPINTTVLSTARLSGVCLAASALLGGCLGDEPTETDDPISEAVSESAAQCEGGNNGFIDIPDNLLGASHPRRGTIAPGVTVTLEVGTVAGRQRGWAKLTGSTRPGDLVWMDWTNSWRPGGPPEGQWLQCGPFRVDTAGMSKTSAAKQTSSLTSWRFRACGRRPPADSVCAGGLVNGWW